MQDWQNLSDKEKVELIKKGAELTAQVYQVPENLVQNFTKGEYYFHFGKLFPVLEFTDEEPPRKIEENAEQIAIDECLGLYEPRLLKITLFNKGIESAKGIIGCGDEDLTYIVKLHEWAHALVHIGLDDEDRRLCNEKTYEEVCLIKANIIFENIDKVA